MIFIYRYDVSTFEPQTYDIIIKTYNHILLSNVQRLLTVTFTVTLIPVFLTLTQTISLTISKTLTITFAQTRTKTRRHF